MFLLPSPEKTHTVLAARGLSSARAPRRRAFRSGAEVIPVMYRWELIPGVASEEPRALGD